MKRVIITYKDSIIRVNISSDNTTIIDSYRFKSIRDMINVIRIIRSEAKSSDAIYTRSLFSMINEWRVHNLLYTLGIEELRTSSVDLDANQPWYMKLIYTTLSPFYFHFM